MNVKKLAIPAMCLGLLGVVGGVAAANAFQPAAPQPKVQFVQPATQVVTPEPVATTTAPKPVAPKPVTVKKVAPAKVAPKPVQSTTKATSSAATVQRQATVAQEPAPEPTPQADPAPSPTAPPGVIDWRNVNPPPPPPSK